MNPASNSLSEAELQQEWWYRYEERLGMLCGSSQPTLEQKTIARNEASQAVLTLSQAESEQ